MLTTLWPIRMHEICQPKSRENWVDKFWAFWLVNALSTRFKRLVAPYCESPELSPGKASNLSLLLIIPPCQPSIVNTGVICTSFFSYMYLYPTSKSFGLAKGRVDHSLWLTDTICYPSLYIRTDPVYFPNYSFFIVKYKMCKTIATWFNVFLFIMRDLMWKGEHFPTDTHHFGFPLIHRTTRYVH